MVDFHPLEHRLTCLGTFREITFYDDSNATIPSATIKALKVLNSQVDTLILGGSEKNIAFDSLAQKILESKINNLILFRDTGEKIWQAILAQKRGDIKLPKHISVQDMPTAVRLAYKLTRPGKICLLSPASASFSIFKNYKERGELFQKWVRKLAL